MLLVTFFDGHAPLADSMVGRDTDSVIEPPAMSLRENEYRNQEHDSAGCDRL